MTFKNMSKSLVFNPLATNVPIISGFYMMGTLVTKELKLDRI